MLPAISLQLDYIITLSSSNANFAIPGQINI